MYINILQPTPNMKQHNACIYMPTVHTLFSSTGLCQGATFRFEDKLSACNTNDRFYAPEAEYMVITHILKKQ